MKVFLHFPIQAHPLIGSQPVFPSYCSVIQTFNNNNIQNYGIIFCRNYFVNIMLVNLKINIVMDKYN